MKTKLYLGEAVGLVVKTAPFMAVRVGSYAVLAAGLMVYFGVIGGVAWMLGQLWSVLGVITFLAGVGGAFGIVHWVTRYYFHLLRAAHTAVMTEFIVYGRGPTGSQVAHGKAEVMSRFRDTSILFAVDRLVAGIVRTVTRTVGNVMRILPIPGLDGLRTFLNRVARYSTTYIDEAILSLAYRDREENVWKVAQDGVILYAMCWKPVLANAVVLTLLSYVQFFLFLVLLGIPALALGAVLPSLQVMLGVGVLVGAWMLKLAVADAFSLASTLLAFHRSIEGVVPDPTWQGRLEGMTGKFKELTAKAREKVAPASAESSVGPEVVQSGLEPA